MKTLFKIMTIALIIYVLSGVTSCTTYTCPTYSKVETQTSKI